MSTPEAPPASARVAWGPLSLFLVIALGGAWLVALPLWLGDGLADPIANVLIPVMMYTPALAAVVAVLLEGRREASRARRLGLWPLRPVGRLFAMIGIGVGVSVAIVIAGAFLAGALGLAILDLVGFSGLAEQVPDAGIPLGLLVLLQVITVPIPTILNAFLTFGEELGWRGYLVPALRPLGVWPALLGSGAIWGLWHAPVILLGFNYGEPNPFGLLLMVVGCALYGVFMGWLRLRSRSVWPAVFAHGAFNAAGGFLLLISVPGTPVASPLLSPVGVVTWIVMVAVAGILVATGQLPPPWRRGRDQGPVIGPAPAADAAESPATGT